MGYVNTCDSQLSSKNEVFIDHFLVFFVAHVVNHQQCIFTVSFQVSRWRQFTQFGKECDVFLDFFLKEFVTKTKNTAREISIDYIQKVVCDYFDIPIELMKSKTRKREIVQARQLAMYFSKQLTKNSLANIGIHCGNKDHATVLHDCKKVNNLIDTDKQFKAYVNDIEKKLTLN